MPPPRFWGPYLCKITVWEESLFFSGHIFNKITEIFELVFGAISLQTHDLGEILKIYLTGHFFACLLGIFMNTYHEYRDLWLFYYLFIMSVYDSLV